MTTNQALDKLMAGSCYPDALSKSKGVFTARKGFFYTGGKTADAFAARVKEALPEANILEQGEVWLPFRGGAPITRQSHWFVRFTL